MSTNVSTLTLAPELKSKSDSNEQNSVCTHLASLVNMCINRKAYVVSENNLGVPCLKIELAQLKKARFFLPLYDNTHESEKENKENFEDLPIKTVKDIKLKILELLNLSYVKQDFFNAYKTNTDFILKIFFPNLYNDLKKYNLMLHPDVCVLFIENVEKSIMYSIKALQQLLDIIGDKTKTGEEIINAFYDCLVESKNAIKIDKNKKLEELKPLIDKVPPYLIASMKCEAVIVHESIIVLIDKILPVMENVVSHQQKTFWMYAETVECTLPGEPFGRHVKLSLYSQELKNFYDAFSKRLEFLKKQTRDQEQLDQNIVTQEKLEIITLAEIGAYACVAELNELGRARTQKIIINTK